VTGGHELKEILYFDESGIEDLSNQVGAGKLATFSKESETSRDYSGGIKPRVGLGAILKFLGGPTVDVDAEINLKRAKGEKSTENFIVTRQDRYQRVVDALGGATKLGHTLDRAWYLALSKGSEFCLIREDFRPIHTINDPDGWRKSANSMQFLQLVDEPTALFRVGMSFEKIVGIRDNTIPPLGHLAIRLRGGTVSLSIFGKMDRSRYVKPFVITWS
jgi:hypothetical protein